MITPRISASESAENFSISAVNSSMLASPSVYAVAYHFLTPPRATPGCGFSTKLNFIAIAYCFG